MTTILKIKTQAGSEIDLTPKDVADQPPPKRRQRATTAKAKPEQVKDKVKGKKTAKPKAPKQEPQHRLIVTPAPPEASQVAHIVPATVSPETEFNPTPLVVRVPKLEVVLPPERNAYNHEFQTKLSAGERLIARKFGLPAPPSGWEQRWSQEADGLRKLLRIAVDALQKDPSLGLGVVAAPGTYSKVVSIRVDLELFNLVNSVKLPDESEYALIKRLVQIGASARPDIRDRFLA